jgi:hypothetical protein
MLKFILGLDAIIIKKCAELGAIFHLGAFEGAVIYVVFALCGVYMSLKLQGKIEVKKK